MISKFKQIIILLKDILNHPLNKKNKFKAISRFIAFNITRRLVSKNELIIPWIDNAKFIISFNEIQLRFNIYWGMVEYEEMSFVIHCLRKENIFIDCGANIGIYSILASKVVGSKSIAFEPHPETIKRMVDQISINKVNDSVKIIQKAVGSEIGKMNFTNFTNKSNLLNKIQSNTDDAGKTISVDVTTLDHELNNVDQNYIIKIDIEGYEQAAIQGAKSLLTCKKFTALIIENNQMSNNFNVERNTIHQTLTDFGLFPVKYDPIERKVTKIDFEKSKSLNLIYINDLKKIQELCFTSKKFKLHTANNITI